MKFKQINYKNLINTFSNYLIKNGKKKKILSLFFKILKNNKKKGYSFHHFFLIVFIIFRIRPTMQLKTIKKGSQYYIFPTPFKQHKSFKLALLWVSKTIKNRNEYTLKHRIKNETTNLLNKQGNTWKQYLAFQKKVSENILYSHYRWR